MDKFFFYFDIFYTLGKDNWIFALLEGLIILKLIHLSSKGIIYIYLLFFFKDKILGTWYNHFFSYDGNKPIFKTEAFEISLGFKNKIVVNTYFCDDPDSTYNGRIIYEKDFMIVEMNANKHIEKTYSRFHLPPILTKETVLTGISLAQDFSGYATSAINILSRKKLDEATVKKHLSQRSLIDQSRRSIRAKKRK